MPPVKYIHGLVLSIIIYSWVVSGNATQVDHSSIVKLQDNYWLLSIQQRPLGEVIADIYRDFQVEIHGLESRKKEIVTLSAPGKSLPDLIRSLLQWLNEKNYAFEFVDNRLKRVVVLPETSDDLPSGSTVGSLSEVEQSKSVNAVEIQGVVEDSQAKNLNFQKGDLILEYDGVKISQSSELVRETRKKSPDEEVELLLLRNGDFIRMNAKGGLLGIRIKTVKVFAEELRGTNGH